MDKASQRIGVFVMAHGAGAPMDSEWMNQMSAALVAREIQVIRFEFPYMSRRRVEGIKAPPNPTPRLLERWREVLKSLELPRKKIFIGGKSMGGRMASLLAQEEEFAGLICLGFPFHPPGKKLDPERLAPLTKIKCPALILQGERDALGNKQEVLACKLPRTVRTIFLPDGDHSFKPLKRSGLTLETNLNRAADHIASFIKTP